MNENNIKIKVAVIGAVAVVLAAIIGLLKCNSEEPPKTEQKQEVNITNQPVIEIMFDSNSQNKINNNITKDKDRIGEKHNPSLPIKKISKKDFNKFIKIGEGYLNDVRGNEEKIKEWERNCLAILSSVNPQNAIEYNKFKNQYNNNPPEKNIVDTLLLLLKTEKEKVVD